MPLGIVVAGRDGWLAPRFHSEALLRACAGCTRIATLPTAGHGAFLGPMPPLQGVAADLLNDPPGFDRKLLEPVHAAVAAFFRKHL